ncbi:MAG: hypothetical protein RLZZ618_3099, partial [Pseudomonadota bacterium]
PTRNEAKAGNYGVVYESTMQWNTERATPGSDLEAFLAAIRSNAGRSAALAKLDVDTQQGVMASPSSYTGGYVDQVGDVAAFGSRVSRLAANSCAPLRVTK